MSPMMVLLLTLKLLLSELLLPQPTMLLSLLPQPTTPLWSMLPQPTMPPLWCMLLPLSTVEPDKCLTSLCLSPTRESTGPPPSQRLSDLPSPQSLTTPMLPMDVGSQGLWLMLLSLPPLVRHYSRQYSKVTGRNQDQ